MFGQLIRTLLYICAMALAFYLVLWVLGAIGFALPAMVEKILIVMFILVCILILYQLWSPYLSGINWWGRPPPVVLIGLALGLALAACQSGAQPPPLVAKACAIYENTLTQVAVEIGVSFVPGAAAIKAAIDPWVLTICNGTAATALADPTTPTFIMEQVNKVLAVKRF